MNPQEKKDKQVEQDIMMFGEAESAMVNAKPSYVGNRMYAMMILSDAQEVLTRDPARAWQFINKAKYFIERDINTAAANRLDAYVVTKWECEGERGLTTKCDDYAMLKTLPAVLECDGYRCIMSGWNSDKQEAYYKTRRQVFGRETHEGKAVAYPKK